MAKINLSTATKAEMIAHAVKQIGITQEEADAMGKEQLKDFIRENDIHLHDDTPVADAAGAGDNGSSEEESEPTKEAVDYNKRVKIIIHEQEGVGGADDVCVGVNGIAYQIKRGHEVEVPLSVVRVLEDAVITAYEPIPNRPGEYAERHYRRFNFNIVI